MGIFESWSHFEAYLLLGGNGYLEIRFMPPKKSGASFGKTWKADYMRRLRWAYFDHIGTNKKFVANITAYGKNPVYSKEMTFDDKDTFITSIKVITSGDISNLNLLLMNPAIDKKTASRCVLIQQAFAYRVYRLKEAWRNVRYLPARVRRYIRNKTRRKAFWEQ